MTEAPRTVVNLGRVRGQEHTGARLAIVFMSQCTIGRIWDEIEMTAYLVRIYRSMDLAEQELLGCLSEAWSKRYYENDRCKNH